jgi:hypothetical protein
MISIERQGIRNKSSSSVNDSYSNGTQHSPEGSVMVGFQPTIFKYQLISRPLDRCRGSNPCSSGDRVGTRSPQFTTCWSRARISRSYPNIPVANLTTTYESMTPRNTAASSLHRQTNNRPLNGHSSSRKTTEPVILKRYPPTILKYPPTILKST